VFGSSSVFIPLSVFVYYPVCNTIFVYYPVCNTIFECKNVEDLLLVLLYDLLILCMYKHVGFKSLWSREVVSCHLLCCFRGWYHFLGVWRPVVLELVCCYSVIVELSC